MTEIRIDYSTAAPFTNFIFDTMRMNEKFFDATPLVTFTKSDEGTIATISEILINGTRQAVKEPRTCKVTSTVGEEELNIAYKVTRTSYTPDGEPLIIIESIA